MPGEEGSHLGQEILRLGLNIATLKSRENACSMMPTDLLPYPPPPPTLGIRARVMGSGDIPESSPLAWDF